MSENKNYDVIFKSTFLFAFVQAFSILVKVVLNKVAAVTLGSAGIGMIGLFSSAIGMLKTGTSLGISQSAVRDISEANQNNDIEAFSKTIIATQKIIVITAAIGFVITAVLSPWLSEWSFGNNLYTTSFLLLSIAVAFITLWEGQLAILKGMRHLRLLAKANVFGSLVGLFISIPLYLVFEIEGIIPVLIITPICAYLFSYYYVRKIEYRRIKLSKRELVQKATPMVKMGVALSITTFLSQLSVFLVSSYIGKEGGLQSVGFYNAGVIIMVGYFSVIINALTTDYYPRIAAVNNDNAKVQNELNQQSIVSLLISFPLIVLFLMVLPFLITLLYSKEFDPIINFIRIGIYGVLITIISNQVDLILIAKNNTKFFTILAIVYRVIELVLNVVFFKFYGLIGMGISMVLGGVIHMVFMTVAVKKLYLIRFEKLFVKTALLALLFIFLTSFISMEENVYIRYSAGGLMFVLSCFFSYYFSKKYLNFNLLKMRSK
ncbi:oligosaccharide flippase family protein [Flavobacterium muglaense]|uniref:Oligosaccharide flippase family protein n=1 Tax=Flavobacterium muglaense TaxID=2764716 RepID=A0A923SFA8_9FLAO|nr:oligosaccharide flippase family protein [Flavobacterium muglaense]MBC5837040.1 oligosaccharide flippase family protein [Flavobacterium muglaense]MBC5843569.1 oligosaccharide flippase family protein [Flavobacterium muglaense]